MFKSTFKFWAFKFYVLKYLCFWSSKQVQELNFKVETQNLDMETQRLGACFKVLNLNSNERIFYPN
jgi:hypothetical protein